jgi:hypothetical protein
MSTWLAVVSADHVARATSLGIVQLGHGKRTPIARMHPGDWLVFYSPRTSLTDGTPLKSFTAIGEVVDDEIWQADDGDFRPYRRRIRYLPVGAPVSVVGLDLDLTSAPNWGYALRLGLVPLSERDLATIRAALASG